MGQKGRCLNDRLREHRAALSVILSDHLAIHCSRCGRVPEFHSTEAMGSYKVKVAREIVEACRIKKEATRCVSAPSFVLVDDETVILEACAL